MTGITPATGNSITPRRPGSWIGAHSLDSARGLALLGLVLAEAGLLLALTLELSFAIFAFPLLYIPATVLAVRRVANATRRLSGEWCGVPIAVPYRPYAALSDQAGTWRRFGCAMGRLFTEPATWRDLLWEIVDTLIAWLIPFIPAAVVLWGLFGVFMPAYWSPIVHAGGNQWYAFIHVGSWLTAVLCVPLGFAFIALGLWCAPKCLECYGAVARSMLGPTKQAALEQQVAHLSESRAEVVDTGAAEIRRIERDLHDGAQARLVAMGMTLSAAERRQPSGRAGAAARGPRRLGQGAHRASRPGARDSPAGARRPRHRRGGPGAGHGQPAEDQGDQRAARPATGAGRVRGLLRGQRAAGQRVQARRRAPGLDRHAVRARNAADRRRR